MFQQDQDKKMGVSFSLMGLLLLGSLFLASGCAPFVAMGVGGAAGAGGVAYVQGDLETTMAHQPERIAGATEAAFRSLGISHKETNSTTLHSVVKGKNQAGKEVYVTSDFRGEGGSEVSIRVGFFGNRKKSQAILKEIRANL